MTSSSFTRRQLVKGLSASLGVLALRGFSVHAGSAVAAYFTHGVASGDPLSDRVILWTRVLSGDGQHRTIPVHWQVAEDAEFTSVVSEGHTETSQLQDYTVKVDAAGLKPKHNYYYRFLVEGLSSPVGRTLTLPQGNIDRYKMAVVSCSNYPQGYFNVYNHIAQTDVDVVLHLGDYIYEYKDGGYDNEYARETLGRRVQPAHEIVALEDYRMRYGLYRSDADLQAVHARHPFICVWDDHELSNDTWKDGAENHNEAEGDFHQRMHHARQAYHEWLPIRTSVDGPQASIYRRFKIGDLADLIMLDTRLHGRDRGFDYRSDLSNKTGAFKIDEANGPVYLGPSSEVKDSGAGIEHLALPYDLSSGRPVAVTDYQKIKPLNQQSLPGHWRYIPDIKDFRENKLNDKSRNLLGVDQEEWLNVQLKDSKQRGAVWQVLGQQVLAGKVGIPSLRDEELNLDLTKGEVPNYVKFMQGMAGQNLPLNLDAWDGYPNCRDRMFDSLLAHAHNPLVLAGDTHNAWAFNLSNKHGKAVGVEIATPSVSSPGLEHYVPVQADVAARALKDCSPEIVDVDTSQRGWAELILTPEAMSSQWHFVSTILDKNFSTSESKMLVSKAGSRKLDFA